MRRVRAANLKISLVLKSAAHAALFSRSLAPPRYHSKRQVAHHFMMLDGKYEIISQRPLGPRSTLFDATAPDGAAVRVAWYSVDPEEEAAFERYRKLLRALKRDGFAAIHDLVARPGAHYVAWYVPPSEVREEDKAIEARLEAHGWSLEDAHLCADKDGVKLYALAFERAELDQASEVSTRTVQVIPTAPLEQPRSKRSFAPWLTPLIPRIKPWLPGATLALLGMLLLISSFYRPINRDFVVVPPLQGQEISESVMALRQLGLRASPSPVPTTGNVGQVLSSEPPAGAQLRPGRTVRLRYALPPGQLAPTNVPDLSGLTVEEAQTQLGAAGLELGDLSRIYSPRPSGTVIAQSQQDEAPTGSAVHLLVSEGPQGALTFLPDLTGVSLADANALIRAAGLGNPEIERVTGTGQPAGTVVAQNIAPDQLIAQDAAVLRLTVTADTPRDTSSESVSGVPNFVGMSLDAARRLATREGLRVQSRPISSANLPQGVALQDPAPGTALENQTVMLTLNSPPLRVPRPDVDVDVNVDGDAPVGGSELRRLSYAWNIQPGTPEQVAQVMVTTPSGERELIAAQRVRGGERIEGVWRTREPGPVTFTLTLDGLLYGESIRVNP